MRVALERLRFGADERYGIERPMELVNERTVRERPFPPLLPL